MDPRGILTYQSLRFNVVGNLQWVTGSPLRISRGSKKPKNGKKIIIFSAALQMKVPYKSLPSKDLGGVQIDNRGLGLIGPLKSPHTQVIQG